MTKDEMIRLIKALDAINLLDELLGVICGTDGMYRSRFNDMCGVAVVIHMNCPFYIPDNDESIKKFFDIILNYALTAEEKYDLLMGGDTE